MVDHARFAELEAAPDGHDHFGLVYDSRREQLDVVVPFLRRGLDRGDQVVYVYDDTTPAEISAALRAAGVDVETARESGALTFCEAADVYRFDGDLGAESTLHRVEAAVGGDVVESGQLRVTSELTGSLVDRIGSDALLSYESGIDRLLAETEVVGLCQYDRSSLPQQLLEAVVASHPRLAYDGVVGTNAYYEHAAPSDPSSSALAEKLAAHRRTVSTRRSLQRRESGIAALVCATEELLWADPDDVPDVVAEATRSALGCEHASLWLYDRESDDLVCRSRSSAGSGDRWIAADASPGSADEQSGATADAPADSENQRGTTEGPRGDQRLLEDLAWEAFVTNEERHWHDGEERHWHDGEDGDSRATRERAAVGTRSGGVALPLAGTGALVAATETSDRIDRDGLEIARAVAGVASLAFEKARQDRHIEDLREECTRSATAETILRDLVRKTVGATNRRDVERALCETLAAVDDVAFVWSGAVDPEEETVTPRASAGESPDFLSAAVADEPAPEPVVDAVSSTEPTVVSRIADERPEQPWTRAALDRGFRSVASVPLYDDQVTYGAVTLYASRPEAFAGTLEAPLADVGRFVGYLLDVVERDVPVGTGQSREVELELSAPAFPFVELAAELECRLEVDDVVSHGDCGVVAVARLPEAAHDRLAVAADATDAIEGAEVVEESDDGVLLDLSLADEFVGAGLRRQGAAITTLTADPETARLVVQAPEAVGERTVVDAVAEQYDRPTLLATRAADSTAPRSASPATVGGDLTDRQREVAAVAYHAGYFDSPRRCTGEEVADVLDISPQAFYQHLRRMERTLFDQVVTGP